MASEVGVLDVAAGERAAQGPAAAGPHVPGRPGAGPHHRRRGDQAARSPREHPYGEWLRENIVSLERSARRCRRSSASSPTTTTVLAAAAGVRLHQRGPEDPAGADGAGRQRGGRLDGQRRGPGRALGPAAAALQLLQAALRPGHQPAGRLHPRRDHHVDGDDHRLRAQPARADAAVGPADQAARRRS